MKGTLDRLAKASDGLRLIDYKTDGAKSADRLKRDPQEDVQLPFYALLLQGSAELTVSLSQVEAGYLSLSDSKSKPVRFDAHPNVAQAAKRVLEAIQSDVQGLRAGEGLWPLGEGTDCQHCASRGLCRKDHWPTFDAQAHDNLVEAGEGEA